MTILSGCWMGARGIACAEDAKARAKATALNLIIASLPFDIGQKRQPAFSTLYRNTIWAGKILIWINRVRFTQWLNDARGAAHTQETIMTRLTLLAVSLGTGVAFAAIPTSINLSPANVASLSLLSTDTADARIGRPLTPLSVAGVNRRANRRAYRSAYYGTGVVGAGVVGAGVVAAGAATTGYAAGTESSFAAGEVALPPGVSAIVTDPATGRRCTISTTGYKWCWRP
jgi:hypothetical protein